MRSLKSVAAEICIVSFFPLNCGVYGESKPIPLHSQSSRVLNTSFSPPPKNSTCLVYIFHKKSHRRLLPHAKQASYYRHLMCRVPQQKPTAKRARLKLPPPKQTKIKSVQITHAELKNTRRGRREKGDGNYRHALEIRQRTSRGKTPSHSEDAHAT